MWEWAKRLIKSRPDDKRLIFRFFDGTRNRAVDPIAVERILVHYLTDDWRKTVASLDDTPPMELVGSESDKFWLDREQLRQKVYQVICAAFDVKPFRDDVGLTEIELRALLDGYAAFCNDLLVLASPFVNVQSRASPTTAILPPPSS
jgi:hypothetical protein